MADERSDVDVDERREPAPEPVTQPGLIASATHLAPPQEAYGAYTRHALHCDRCRDIDRERCGDGEQLWRDYHAISDQAFRRLRHDG